MEENKNHPIYGGEENPLEIENNEIESAANFEALQENQWHQVPTKERNSKRLFVVLQGYLHSDESVRDWANYIASQPAIKGDLIYATYNYYLFTFRELGRDLYNKLQQKFPNGGNYEEIIFIGYSMGGMVARSIVSLGYPFARLYTLCSPHHGMFNFLNVPLILGRGYDSLKWGSYDLWYIWRMRQDQINRAKFYCIGYYYTINNRRNKFLDDTAMALKSSTGGHFDKVYKRKSVLYHYDSWFVPVPAFYPEAAHVLPGKENRFQETLAPILNDIKDSFYY